MIDSGALISQLFSSFWWLLSLLIIAALFKPAWFKGFIGEVMVTWLLALFGSSCKAANGLEDIGLTLAFIGLTLAFTKVSSVKSWSIWLPASF